jgi:hypothetical protein
MEKVAMAQRAQEFREDSAWLASAKSTGTQVSLGTQSANHLGRKFKLLPPSNKKSTALSPPIADTPTLSQPECAERNAISVEIVEVDKLHLDLPVVTFNTLQEILERIRGKSLIKGIQKMASIHNELLALEAQIDSEVLDSTLCVNQS